MHKNTTAPLGLGQNDIDPYNENNILISIDDVKNIYSKFNIIINPSNINYYITSLTHKSYIKKEYYDLNMITNTKNNMELFDESNERLEFLGDTVIKCIISTYLFIRYRNEDEGFMTRLKAKIECRHTLAIFARVINLNKFMIISRQIELIDGRNSDKLLEDCFEAFIGATYIDSGFDICKKLLFILLEEEIDYSELLYKDTNYKDQILRFYAQNNWSFPEYELIETIVSPNNKKQFLVGIKDYRQKIIATAKANNIKKAEQYASMLALYNFNIISKDQMIEMQ